jgi:hypothetical protein
MIDEFIWRANKDVLRHLDRRVLQLDPAWCDANGLLFTEFQCKIAEEVWMDGEVLNIWTEFGRYEIPMSAILNREIVPDIIKDRPRFWGKP